MNLKQIKHNKDRADVSQILVYFYTSRPVGLDLAAIREYTINMLISLLAK